MDDTIRTADRVFQLEAHNLEQEFDRIVDQLVDAAEVPLFSEETKLLLKLYLFANHIRSGTTIGKRTFNLEYHETSISGSRTERAKPSNYKLFLLTACNMLLPYLHRRSNKIENLVGHCRLPSLKLNWLKLDNVTMILKSLSILNFLLFLRNGKYLKLHERILGLESGMSDQDYFNNTFINKIQMEYMVRDTIWEALAEFLTSMIPLINTQRAKNQVLRVLGWMPKMSEELKLSDKMFTKKNTENCAVCGKQPFNPYMIGCRHVFCYYCLHSRYLSDPADGYICLLCNYGTKDQSQVQRYRILESL